VSNSWNRPHIWLAAIVLPVCGLGIAIGSLHLYVSATAETLHPDAQRVPTQAATTPPKADANAVERARQAVRTSVSEQNLPGVSVAVGLGGEIVWAEGFGYADLEDRIPVSPSTRFRIGTASKALTSAGVGLLLEQQRLRLDEPIRTYVPAWPETPWPVTLRQVMGHTAGIGNDGGDEGPLFSTRCERPVEALEAFADDALRFEPGTQYRYSSYGWILVSSAVEYASQEPFLTFMHTHVFAPLGMQDTRADSATTPILDGASSYFPRYGGDPKYGLHDTRPLDYSCYAGASAFLSTPSDLVRFGLAIDGGTLLKPETVRLLQTSQTLRDGKATGYGLGWDLETVTLAGTPTTAIGHDGDILAGTVASLMTFPDRGLVVAVTSNISYSDTAAIALKVADAFVAPAQ
jgi:serine beta-lactamase-like protein LACTB